MVSDELDDPWRVVITRVSNGYWIHGSEGDAVAVEGKDATEAALHMLWEVNERVGEIGSRYDAERISIGVAPGDKHHDLHPEPCAECACACGVTKNAL